MEKIIGDFSTLVRLTPDEARNAGQIATPSNNYWHHPNYETGRQNFSIVEDQRIVVGPAMIPSALILRTDQDGNPYHVYFSKETVKKIAEKFIANYTHATDVNHDFNVTTNNKLVESWIIEDPEKDKSQLYGFNLPTGTWMCSFKINDDETWQKIKSGELRGYSITGDFVSKSQTNG